MPCPPESLTGGPGGRNLSLFWRARIRSGDSSLDRRAGASYDADVVATRGTSLDAGRLREAAGRLRHDLGKYVRFSAAAAREVGTEALRERLRADLLATRSGPSGTMTAVEVFDSWQAEEGRGFPADGPLGEGLRRIAGAVEMVRELAPRLAGLRREELERLDEATLVIARETRLLEREAAAGELPR
jgi:hypothetical protein